MSDTALIVSGIDSPDISVNESLTEERDLALESASLVPRVTNPAQFAMATAAIGRLNSIAKTVETSRKEVKAPVIALGKRIDDVAAQFLGKVTTEVARLKSGASAYQAEVDRQAREAREKAERERREAEEKARREAEAKAKEEMAKAKTQEDLDRAAQTLADTEKKIAEEARPLLTPVATATAQAKGTVITKPWRFRVKDIKALYAAKPELCEVLVSASRVNEAIRNGLRECPGLEIYQDTNVTVRT